MIQRLVSQALQTPSWVILGAFLLTAGGIAAYHQLDIEAYPNPIPPLVEVITQPDGWSAEEVERYITIPLEVGLSGIQGLEHMRAQSLFGLSDIKCYFTQGTDYGAARQEVINRLQFVTLPNGHQAHISPWNATGEVFRYTLEGPGYSLAELKTAQDWILERQWKRVDGVVDVTSFGGETKQYHVEVDPYRMRGQKVTLMQISSAIANANMNVGGQHLSLGEQSYHIRGIGLLKNVHDIENIVISEQDSTPVRVRDVASISIGSALRLGMVGQNERNDVVQGVILMRYGSQTPATLQGIYERLYDIQTHQILPPGMEIKPFYDRGSLVHTTSHTVIENMLLGMGLVILVLFAFLNSFRAALLTAINIPLALMVAFGGLVLSGTSANLISMGAIDFGIVVDSTVIMMENIFQHLGSDTKETMAQRIYQAAGEVARPMAFSTAIMGVTFLPLFTLSGVAGIIFEPMARTYALAILGAIVLALTVTPVLTLYFIPVDFHEKDNIIMRFLHRLYRPLFDLALTYPHHAIFLGLIPIVLCIFLFPLLGREFMPKLEEGNLWIRATLPMSISLEQSSKYASRMRDILRGCAMDSPDSCGPAHRKHPEILLVQSQLGRPDNGTDVAGFFNVEFFCPLKPLNEFPRGLTKAKLIDQLNTELHAAFPGVVFNFSQAISDNIEEAVAGVKGENSIKVFGSQLQTNEDLATKIVNILSHVKGITDLGMLHSLGQPDIKITPDRHACARYGLNTGDVDTAIQAALGGQVVTSLFEGEKHFDLTVRWLPQYRQSLNAIKRIAISTPDNTYIPLGQLASIELTNGPATIYREDGQRYAPIKFSVRGRDLAGAIYEAQEKIHKQVKLPYGSRLEWSGEINEMQKTQKRLMIIVPLSLILVALLSYGAVKNWMDTLIVLIDIPVACTGGLVALLIAGEHLSVSAFMGFVSIFGIAIQDAILVVTYFQRMMEQENCGIVQAARQASEKRFRPVLMTTLVATMGLLPAALSNGIGAQTQKPLAIVVIGGSLMVAILTRVLQPTLLVVAHLWQEKRRLRSAS